jgi:C4-dicarboxylate transporter, DctM subunit
MLLSVKEMFNSINKFPLAAIPFFILAGNLMETGGISRRLVECAKSLVGGVQGGLPMTCVLTCMIFAAVSGSSVATTFAIGAILIPALIKHGYPTSYAAALQATSAELGVIIPPSIPMILYAVMAGTSVVQLFVAGIVPGLIAGFAMMGLCHYYAVKYNWPVEEIFQLKKLWSSFRDASWALTLPLIILGGIFGGIVTATEGAALAVVAALFVGHFIYHELDWRHLRETVIDGAVQTGVVMLLVATSTLLGLYLTEVQVPQNIATALLGVTKEKWMVLALLNLFFLFIGMFLHSAAAIILVVPIVMPLVTAAGIDPVHFGIIVTLNLAIGQQTPPVASVLMITCSIAKENVWDVTRANLPFIGVLVATLLLITYVPVVTLGLVNFFYR